MTRRRIPIILLTVLAMAGFVAPAQAADPVRILLEGDSITQGFHGDFTWRYRLDRELDRQGVAADLVGTRNAPYPSKGFTAAKYADPAFDTGHFAQGGSTLGAHVGWIAAEVNSQDPDLVVLAAGVNDLRAGASPAVVDGRLRAWITAARSAKPTIRLVVSPVLQSTDATRPWLGDRIREYNARAVATADELSLPGVSPITVSDTGRGWSVPAHTYDNIHPNPTGETLIAQRIAEHLKELGDLDQTPTIFRTTAWNRPIASRVALLSDRRATVTWDGQGVYAHVLIQRQGYAATVGSYSGSAMTTRALAPGATYVFRVQYVRGRMSTPYGPVHRVSVPQLRRPAAVARVVVSSAGVSWTRSPLATRYVVKFRKANKKRWITRQTTGLSISAPKVKRAKVWAVNASGRSAVRIGHR